LDLEEGNKEQIRRMELYRRKISEDLGFDIGETGYFAWVEKYSDRFRKWVESMPQERGTTGFIGQDFIED
jgi:hypothetical protein